MDVQATAEAAPLPPITFPPPAPIPAPAPVAAPAAVSGVGPASGPTGSSASGNGAVGTGASSAPPDIQVPSLPPKLSGIDAESLGATVGKLFNTAADNVAVSFQVAPGSNEVVVVFTDKTSGKTIIQFPSETLVALAQFFNKLAGTVLDKKA
jgi:hypothetical protein